MSAASADRMREDLACQLAQQTHLCWLIQFLVYRVYALAPVIPDSAQSVASNSASYRTRRVRHDEAKRSTADSSDNAPELRGRVVVFAFSHAFFPVIMQVSV